MLNQPLKEKLIASLYAVAKHTHDIQRMNRVIDAIKSVAIPQTDYKNVAEFIFLLLDERPEIMNAHPHDLLLKTLCLYCLDHLKNKLS